MFRMKSRERKPRSFSRRTKRQQTYVFHNVHGLCFDLTHRVVEITYIDGEERRTAKFKGIKSIDTQHYLDGLMISAGSEKGFSKRIHIDVDEEKPLYVIVKNGVVYLFDDRYCREYPEECVIG